MLEVVWKIESVQQSDIICHEFATIIPVSEITNKIKCVLMSDFTVGFLANLGSSIPWVVKHSASFEIYAGDQT